MCFSARVQNIVGGGETQFVLLEVDLSRLLNLLAGNAASAITSQVSLIQTIPSDTPMTIQQVVTIAKTMNPQENTFNGELDSVLMHLEDNQLVAIQVSNTNKKPLLKLTTAQTQLSNAFLTYQRNATEEGLGGSLVVYALCYRDSSPADPAAWTIRRYAFDETWVKALTAVLI